MIKVKRLNMTKYTEKNKNIFRIEEENTKEVRYIEEYTFCQNLEYDVNHIVWIYLHKDMLYFAKVDFRNFNSNSFEDNYTLTIKMYKLLNGLSEDMNFLFNINLIITNWKAHDIETYNYIGRKFIEAYENEWLENIILSYVEDFIVNGEINIGEDKEFAQRIFRYMQDKENKNNLLEKIEETCNKLSFTLLRGLINSKKCLFKDMLKNQLFSMSSEIYYDFLKEFYKQILLLEEKEREETNKDIIEENIFTF